MLSERADRVVAPLGKLSLRTKGILVVAIPVCALLVAMLVFYLFQKQSRDAADLVEHTYQVRGEIRRAVNQLANADAALHAYLVTGRKPLLEPYFAARRDISRPLDALSRLVGDNQAQSERIARVRGLIAKALDSMDRLQAAKAAGQPPPDAGEVERTKADTAAVLRELDDMLAEEGRLLAQRTDREHRAERRLQAAIFIGGIIGLLGGIVAALLFTTRIVRRVERLEEDAQRVAQGLPILEEAQGDDEIARFQRTLKATSSRLVAQTEQLRRAQTELESRVAQRTSELTAASERLTEATELNHAVIECSPLAIWAIDLEGKVSFWNPAAERIFGWKENEVIGRPLPVVPPEQAEEYRSWIERFRRGESMSAVEATRQKVDGKRIDVMIWTAPLRDSTGKIRGTIAIDSDISQHKLLEAQFRQSQKLEAVGRLAGGVAHDFNNLLTVITGYSEMLVGEAQDRPNLLDYAREIQYAASRAGSLTAQLLAFSRRQISQPRVLDLNEVVLHSMKLLRRVIGEDIDIETHLDRQLGRVKVDPIHIDQVIMNLVVNARDAMENGGKLTIETSNQMLDADYAGRHIGVQPGRYCLLAISDTGVGMSPEVKNRLFEPFFTTKEAGKGTGLGLSIVYGIVKQSNGEIMVYSEPGRGTTFKVYLPTVEAPEEISTAEARSAELRGTETILLCEDDDSIRRLVHAMLVKQGYRVLEAATPEAALDIGRKTDGPIHLLLTDIVMPRSSGFDLMKSLRETVPGVKVLYMSGYTDNQVSRSWAIESGTPFIQKPFTAAALTQKIRDVLGNSTATSPSGPPSPSKS